MTTLEPEIIEKNELAIKRIQEIVGADYAVKPLDGGFSGAGKFTAESPSGSEKLFVKYSEVDNSLAPPRKYVDWLNQEIDVMASMGEQPFVPSVIKAYKGDEYSVLAINQLEWPNKQITWTMENVQKVLKVVRQLKDVRTSDKPAIPPPDAGEQNPWKDVFEQIKSSDPSPYASRAWLEQIRTRVLALDPTELLTPKDFVHGDLRSDNIRLGDGLPTVLVDWTFAGMGNHDLDIAYWLPSVKMEGGPEPWEIMPNRPDLAMMVVGYFFARAMLPEIPDAPMVRTIQRKQLIAALPWLAHELNVPLQ